MSMRIKNCVYIFISFLMLDIMKSFCLVEFFLVGVCVSFLTLFSLHTKTGETTLNDDEKHIEHHF